MVTSFDEIATADEVVFPAAIYRHHMPHPFRADSVVSQYALRRRRACCGGAARTAVDLFSGAGGITLGLLNAGFDVQLCSDISEACEATHHRNFPEIPFIRRDVHQLTGADIRREAGLGMAELDLLIGGPPCQGFSIIGQRRLSDPRNDLFREFMRLAIELRPKAVVIENVTGLATLERGAVLRKLGAAFREAGYVPDCAELLAAQYGVPQMRWRMFFVGWRADLGRSGGFPTPTHGRAGIGDLVPNRTIRPDDSAGFLSIWDAIGDLPPVAAGGVTTTYDRAPATPFQVALRSDAPETLSNHYAPRLSARNLERIRRLKPGDDWRMLPHDLLPAGMQRALRKDHTRRFRRMEWDGVARAIITRFRDPKSGEYIHPEQDRTISIREAARIQSFPDWFVFEKGYSEQYEQVGNAVPPLLVRAIGSELKALMDAPRGERRSPVKSRYRLPEELALQMV